MFVVSVIPVSRGIGIHELTYFSMKEYEPGSFITVPVRGKEKEAMVLSVEDVKNVKAKLRSNNYPLRKIKKQDAKQVVNSGFVEAVKKTARYHSASVGSVLFSVLPKSLMEFEETDFIKTEIQKPKLRGFIIPRVYQGLTGSRIEFYKTSIREAFAALGSVFIMVPTVADGEKVFNALFGGIEKYSFLIHGSLSKKKQKEEIKKILSSKHPVLIVGTPSFLSLPRHDLATIIVEREASGHYKSKVRPFVDSRILAYNMASLSGGQLFLADLPLSIESVYRKKIGDYEEIVTGNHRMTFKTRAKMLNLQDVPTPPKSTFRAVDDKLLERIEEIGEHGGRTFLYVARKGLSPITLCRDCGTAVTCNECGVSVVLHKGKEENHFLCHSCGHIRHAREVCKKCKSWRLEAYGIGTELVEKEIKNTFPGKDLFVVSGDTTNTHVKVKKKMDEFYSTPRSILIGTEMALPYFTKHIPLVGIVSFDSLLSLASWNIYERVASTLTRLREVAGEELLLQTRRPDASVLGMVMSGNFSGYYKNEMKIRKELGYPPYTVLIKISVTGEKNSVEEKMKKAAEFLLPYDLIMFSRFLKAPGGKYTLHGFLRIKREEWPDEELLNRLNKLSPSYVVAVNPESVL